MGTSVPERRPHTVLIVDDDPAALKLLYRQLTATGHEVLTAANGVEAMELLLAKGPPIVITDWMMPEMDGIELCRAIRSHEGIRCAYVIIVTAHSDQDRIVEAFEAGADDYLSKPLDRKELLARLRAGERIIGLQHERDGRDLELCRANAEQALAYAKLAEANEKLNHLATYDELTGLVNRREALARLDECWAAAARHGQPLACIMLDIDHFKSCNDVYGHAVGDLVLEEMADCLKKSVRVEETICRIGGEEFLVICPQSDEAMAATAAKRLLEAVEAHVIKSDDIELRVTISLGVAECTPQMDGPDDLMRAADDALYAAKDQGRNRVCRASTSKTEALLEEEPIGSQADPQRTSLIDCDDDPPGKVLVVDDDMATRTLARRLLEREGYQVVEAVDGVDAVARARAEQPEVIVMDAQMPRMDGLECTRRLKEDSDTQHIPVIIASARTDATDIVAGMKTGADDYLTKPLDPKEFLHRVRSMQRLHRGWGELRRSNEVRGEQSRAMTALSDLSRGLTIADSLEAILEQTVQVTAELTCCRRVSIMVPDAENEFLTIAHAIGIDPEVASSVRVPVGGEVAGKVFETGEPIVVNTPAERPRRQPEYDSLFFVSVPMASEALTSSERSVGVLNLTEKQGGHPFEPLEIQCVELIANIAAAAIEDRLMRRARDQARDSIVIALAKLAESRDADTGKHVERVTRFCVLLAQALRSRGPCAKAITDRFLSDLERAVPLHDIGKVAIPDRILLKPGPLTEEETVQMRTHAELGAATIRSVLEHAEGTSFLNMAEEIALGHHEWYDGRGYPRGIRGRAIPLSARIAAVADVYDALATRRVYKDAFPHDRSVAIIVESAGAQFDPDVVDALWMCEEEFERLTIELADDPLTPSAADRPGSRNRREPICPLSEQARRRAGRFEGSCR